MKRRNAEVTKNRKCPKRSRYGDGSLGVSIFMAGKLLIMWMVIVALDFACGFRLEYFWPVWLMLQSVADAYKYQGIGFTVFFISMVVTSDILVYMFVPTAFMFFLASLYVWIQLMMISGIERGVCLQNAIIWMVFLYLEATMRWRDMKADSSSSSLPNSSTASSSSFNWDICRPFAAHCMGYPLVTLSFSIKSFVGYKYRKHKQLQIATENRLFRDLINDALPEENRRPLPEPLLPLEITKNGIIVSGKTLSTDSPTVLSNGFLAVPVNPLPSELPNGTGLPSSSSSSRRTMLQQSTSPPSSDTTNNASRHLQKSQRKSLRLLGDMLSSITAIPLAKPCVVSDDLSSGSSTSSSASSVADAQDLFMNSSSLTKKNFNLEMDNCDGDSVESEKVFRYKESHNRSSSKSNRSLSPRAPQGSHSTLQTYEKESVSGNLATSSATSSNSRNGLNGATSKKNHKESIGDGSVKTENDSLYYSKLEGDVKRLRADLQLSRQLEHDLRSQMATLSTSDKSIRAEMSKLQTDNDLLQQRLTNLLAARSQDKQNALLAEKKLAEEKKLRQQSEAQLDKERKERKAQNDIVPECSATCKQQKRDLESELRQVKRDVASKDEKMRNQGEEINSMKLKKENGKEADMMMAAISQLQDKNAHLEHSLGAETRLKLELFSALGEAKRQVEIHQNNMGDRDKEIRQLKQTIARITEAMNLLPSSGNGNQSVIASFLADASKQHQQQQQQQQQALSNQQKGLQVSSSQSSANRSLSSPDYHQ